VVNPREIPSIVLFSFAEMMKEYYWSRKLAVKYRALVLLAGE
jgi:hypothetical protein